LNIGHCHPKVVAPVQAQVAKLMHTCQIVILYAGYVKVAEKLSQLAPVRGHGKVMLVNSGAKALENAVKIARAATGKNNVICFDGGHHGRTLFTMAMNGKVALYAGDFGTMPGNVIRAPYPVPSLGVSEKEAIRRLHTTLKTDANPRERGLILIACGFYGNTLRFLMPVTIEEEVLNEGLAIVEACLAELTG
jgi:4-aminobutyrate aminotransferase/(S)-3-amino-2-methylpropionate transaminase